MSAWDRNASEPDRHARAKSLVSNELQSYLEALADPSWRVRRAALGLVETFAREQDFVDGLVNSLASEDNAGLRNAASEALSRVGSPAIPALAGALADGEADVRKLVVETLGRIGGTEAERALRAALHDDDVNVRAAAAESLGQIGGESAAEELLAALNELDGEPQTIVYLLDALAKTGHSVELDRLRALWRNPALHRSLYPVLALTGDAEACELLLAGVVSPSRGNRAVAIRSLAQIAVDAECVDVLGREIRSSPRVRESLLDALQHDDETVVSAAVVLLGAMGLPEVAPAILDACSTRTNIELAMETVCALPSAEVVDRLSTELYRVGIESRVLFLETIELIGAPEHVSDLLEIALQSEPRTAEAAVRAVGRIADSAAVEGLINLGARTSSADLLRVIAHAMAEIGRRSPEKVGDRLRQLLDDSELESPWLIALGALARDEDIGILQRAVRDSDSEVRAAAFDAATNFGERFPEEAFILGLTDESPAVRVAAARGLGNYRSQEAVDALLAVLKDPDPWVAAEALRSLGAVGGPKVIATLETAVHSSDSLTVLAAMSALFRLNPPELGEILKPVLRHPDPEVVREVVSVSVRLPERDAEELLTGLLEHRFWVVRRASVDALLGRGIAPTEEQLSRRLGAEEHPLVLASLRRFTGEVTA